MWPFVLAAVASAAPVAPASVQQRVAADIAAGKPIQVHVVVALADNDAQGIVPVADVFGDGDVPRTNLYWGALYGVKTHLRRRGYQVMSTQTSDDVILERVVFVTTVVRGRRRVPVQVTAEAIRGEHIKQATQRFLALAAGHGPGKPHLVLYVGHNGLMDFTLKSTPTPVDGALPRAAGVLACSSDAYFKAALQQAGAERWLTTTNLMAPEGYVVDGAVRAFASHTTPQHVQNAAGDAYARHQKLTRRVGRRVFTGKRTIQPLP